jgi:branched-subunit amino acid aminotransferase/4-amino-4-deoxychorismate lyase
LEGVTRDTLLEIAHASGISASEGTLSPDDLYGAEEVFISSTNRNLLGVGEIAGHKFAGAPGPVTLKLEKTLAGFVAEYVAKRRATRGAVNSR